MKKSIVISTLCVAVCGGSLFAMEGQLVVQGNAPASKPQKFDPQRLTELRTVPLDSPLYTEVLQQARGNKDNKEYRTIKTSLMDIVAASQNPQLATAPELKTEVGELCHHYRTRATTLYTEAKKAGLSLPLLGLGEATQAQQAAQQNLSESLILKSTISAQIAALETNNSDRQMLEAERKQELEEAKAKEEERRELIKQQEILSKQIAQCTREKAEAYERAHSAAEQLVAASKAKKELETSKKDAITRYEQAVEKEKQTKAQMQQKIESLEPLMTQLTNYIKALEADTAASTLAKEIAEQKEKLAKYTEELKEYQQTKEKAEKRESKLHRALVEALSGEQEVKPTNSGEPQAQKVGWGGWLASWFVTSK